MRLTFAQTDDGERFAFCFDADESTSFPFPGFDALGCITHIASGGH
jgi:hypothetical protein